MGAEDLASIAGMEMANTRRWREWGLPLIQHSEFAVTDQYGQFAILGNGQKSEAANDIALPADGCFKFGSSDSIAGRRLEK